tara:strand:+ start:1499 stop:1924 length:426 start_codon:yes stop_codon:yes gene_type:complete
MWTAIGSFFSGLVAPVATYFTEGQKIKAAKSERKDELSKLSLETKLESIRKGEDADIQMDANANGRIPWADDLSFLLWLLPVPLAFLPSCVPHIQAGFQVLSTMPEWYMYSLGMMLISVWGYRRLVIPVIEVVVKAYAKKL